MSAHGFGLYAARQKQLATPETPETFPGANRQLETNALYKSLQFKDVTSCQLQPILYAYHINVVITQDEHVIPPSSFDLPEPLEL